MRKLIFDLIEFYVDYRINQVTLIITLFPIREMMKEHLLRLNS